MPRKKKLTIEEHIELGQAFKDVENAIFNLLDVLNKTHALLAKEQDRVSAFTRGGVFMELKSQLEDCMFRDYRDLKTPAAFSVYYHCDEKADIDSLFD